MLNPISIYLLGTLCAFTLCRAETEDASSVAQTSSNIIAEQQSAPQKDILMSPDLSRIEKVAPPMRVGFRYTTPDGIGYKQGYSTLEAFFSSLNEERGRWLKFLDLRGHVFDNGKMAANAGVGLRRISSSRVWGINAYYDYRNTKRQHYNQVAAGLEMLGRVWDFRVNGYLPVGDKTSHLRHTHFDKFKGHHIILRSTKDFALKGANMEMGHHIGRSLYVAGGPYYLNGQGATTWGGELRASLDLLNHYVRLEGNTSYDHFFKWIGQGQISVNIPFGKSRKIKCSERTCAKKKTMYERAMQRIDRHEIIPVGKYHPESVAIDPVTDMPYFVVFVDNTSSSLGTFESPYSSLAAAHANSGPNDIIYVFPGDGTPNNMNMGIALQDRQMLLGASTVHPIATTLGGISIPTFASTMPALTNAGPAVITLANDNLVSGMLVGNSGNIGISGTGINNFTATQNAIVGSGGSEGIFLSNVTGQMTIDNNVFSQNNASNGAVHIQQTTAQCTASFSYDTFYCQNSSHGIFADLSGTGSISTLNIANSVLNSASGGGNGIFIQPFNDSLISNIMVSNCEINNFVEGIFVNDNSSQLINYLSVTDTNIESCTHVGLVISVLAGSIENVIIANSNILNDAGGGIDLNIFPSGSIFNIEITDSNIIRNNINLAFFVDEGSISNFYAANSHFDRGFIEGIELGPSGVGVIDNFEMNNCSVDYCGTGIDVAEGSVNNFALSNCSLLGNSSVGIGFLFINNAIENINIANCNISNTVNTASIAIVSSAPNNISNLTITNCSLNNSGQQGLVMSFNSSGSIDNLLISNCDINNNGIDGISIEQLSTGVFENISLSNNVVSGNGISFGVGSGLNINSSSEVPNLSVLDTVFLGNINNGIQTNASSFNAVQISGCTINNANNAGINISGSVALLQIQDNSLNGNAVGCQLSPPSSPIPKGIIAGNTFNGNEGPALDIVALSGNSVLSLTNNLFTNTASDSLGYDVTISNTGTLCLDFFQNTDIPVNWGPGLDPYSFTGGTIDLTPRSTQANNTGTINPAPGSFGPCTQ